MTNKVKYPEIRIKDTLFNFVKVRDDADISIYKSYDNSKYLRLGPSNEILQYIKYQKELLIKGFEVAEITDSGNINNKSYFIENSMGESTLGEILVNDKGAIKSNSHIFNLIVSASESLFKTQQKTKCAFSKNIFYESIFLPQLYSDLPSKHSLINSAAEKLSASLKNTPSVISHGDFNPFNITEKGLIDFSYNCWLPLGMDLFSILYHHLSFPKDGDYEITRVYTYSAKAQKYLLKIFNSLFVNYDYTDFNNILPELLLAKTIWSCAAMHDYPKVQKWRHLKAQKMMEKYVSNSNLMIEDYLN